MADIKLEIINQALTAAGEDPLTDLVPGTVMANAAIANYDDFVAEELENGDWKFATKTKDLTLLTARAAKPLEYQYQLPGDCLTAKAVLYNGQVLDGEFFDFEGSVVRCSYGSNISARYIFRPVDSAWPRRFRRIVAQRLEALFLRVTERHSEASGRDQDTSIKTMIARHTESSQRRNRPLGDGTLVNARRGLRRRRY
jgi:hypothetical protein